MRAERNGSAFCFVLDRGGLRVYDLNIRIKG